MMSFIDHFESHLRRILVSENREIQSMCDYLLDCGGKRIRPSIFIALVEDLIREELAEFGEVRESCLDIACGIELIHQSSLVHDDLPALDNDDFRRGKPTLHKVFSEGYAILFGDWLLNKALIIINRSKISPDLKSEILDKLLNANDQLLTGQVLDLTPNQDPIMVAKLKTAALFGGIFACAGILANARDDIKMNLTQLGIDFGMLFQIEDDYRDWERDRTRGSTSNSVMQLSEEDRYRVIDAIVSSFESSWQNLRQGFSLNFYRTFNVIKSLNFAHVKFRLD